MSVQIQIRRDTEANWTSADPILAEGELALSTDVSKLKVGNGADEWSVLEYINLAEVNWGDIGGTLSDQTDLQTALDDLDTAIGTKQASDADLTAIAGLDSGTAGAIASDGAGWIKKTYAQFKTALGLVKADVGLGSVDNTADLDKPISDDTQDALDLKVDLAGGTLSGELNAINDAYDDTWDGNAGVPQKDDIWDADFYRNAFSRSLSALGSAIKFISLLCNWGAPLGNTGLTDGILYFTAIYIDRPATITGVMFFSTQAGSFTADNNNRIGLYSYSGGTLTLVASCANDANLWKGTTNTWITKAFSSTYAASPGIYFIGWLYNTSAQTTQPAIGVAGTLANTIAGSLDLTNSAKLNGRITAQTDLPASQAMSGVTANHTTAGWFGLY